MYVYIQADNGVNENHWYSKLKAAEEHLSGAQR